MGPTLIHKICIYIYLFWTRSSVLLSAPKLTVWMNWISNSGRKKSSHLWNVHTGSETNRVSTSKGNGFISRG